MTEDNPFQSPLVPDSTAPAQPSGDPRRFGRARQVPIVAVLMIVHGAMLCLAGIGLLVFMVFFSGKIADQIEEQQQFQRAAGKPGAPQVNPNAIRWVFTGMYGVLGGVMLVAGLLGIFAGIRNYGFRSRVLGIIALVGGMASLFTCYCVPLSLALLIYGLIIYLSHDAEVAFRWRESQPLGSTV